MSYPHRLLTLDPAQSLLRPAERRLVLLTGQSSFRSSALRPEQEDFLRGVSRERFEIVPAGFPFHEALLPAGRRDPSLLAASIRNTAQVVWTCCHSGYRLALRETLQRLASQTRRSLAIVTGSCGLQMANAVWTSLDLPRGLAVTLVALGPICLAPLRLAGAEVTVVLGDRDPWSRIFYHGPVHLRVGCSHLDYWSSAEVRERVAGILRA